MWKQELDPLGNGALSALVAALPIAFLFWALAIRRLKGHWAAIGALAFSLAVAVVVFGMPARLAALAVLHGACFGIFPIGWIVFCAVMLHTIMDRTGQFEALKTSIASLTTDRRVQAILVAFSFGALIEACAGFGAPVAISAGILAGLGFPLLEAAELCLIANTAPVAFGAIGIPILVAGQVSGLDQMSISQMVGRQLPLLSLIVPFYVVAIMAGTQGLRESWPAALVAGLSFAVTQWWTSNYLGPTLPDILSALVSMIAVGAWLRLRRGRHPLVESDAGIVHVPSWRESLFGWSPFLIVCILMIAWALPSVKDLLERATVVVHVPGLHQAIEPGAGGRPIDAAYKVNWLSAAGTALFFSCLLTAISQRIRLGELLEVYRATLVKLRYPLLTVASLLAYAYLGNASGMTVTLGLFVAGAGLLFPLFSPLLGWLGVFITGSDTSSNAIFGKLQAVTADKIGINPVLTVAANASGGVAGKMVSPQSIAVAAAATGLVGQESTLFRRVIGHSLVLVGVMMALTYLQATALSFMVPAASAIHGQGTAAAASDGPFAAAYLALAAALSLGVAAASRRK